MALLSALLFLTVLRGSAEPGRAADAAAVDPGRPEWADTAFASAAARAIVAAALLIIHVLPIWIAVTTTDDVARIRNSSRPSSTARSRRRSLPGSMVSTFHWGWVGAVLAGVTYLLVYLGWLAVLATLGELVVALLRLLAVWFKRQLFQGRHDNSSGWPAFSPRCPGGCRPAG